jgi:hypothetical protein
MVNGRFTALRPAPKAVILSVAKNPRISLVPSTTARKAVNPAPQRRPNMPIEPNLLPREDEKDDDLARAYLQLQHAEPKSPEWHALFWAWQRMRYLTTHLPQKAWRLVLLIWSMDSSPRVIQNLSAGALEDLLAKHGDEVIYLVEPEARRDPSFAKLLGGVWKNRMTDEVWARVQAVWDRRGWDGTPDE